MNLGMATRPRLMYIMVIAMMTILMPVAIAQNTSTDGLDPNGLEAQQSAALANASANATTTAAQTVTCLADADCKGVLGVNAVCGGGVCLVPSVVSGCSISTLGLCSFSSPLVVVLILLGVFIVLCCLPGILYCFFKSLACFAVKSSTKIVGATARTATRAATVVAKTPYKAGKFESATIGRTPTNNSYQSAAVGRSLSTKKQNYTPSNISQQQQQPQYPRHQHEIQVNDYSRSTGQSSPRTPRGGGRGPLPQPPQVGSYSGSSNLSSNGGRPRNYTQ